MSDRPDPGPPTVSDVRPFVGSEDFGRSHRFYEALGWTTVWTDGTLALMDLAGHRFYLQDFHVQDWVDNTVLVVEVDDPSAWHDHVAAVLAGGDFGDARVRPPHREEAATVCPVWDPSGVLLQFMRFHQG